MTDGQYSAKFTGGGNLGDVVKNLADQLARLKTQIDAVNKSAVAAKPARATKGAGKQASASVEAKQQVQNLKKTLAARKAAEKERAAEHRRELARIKAEADARVNARGRKANAADKARKEKEAKRDSDRAVAQSKRLADKQAREQAKLARDAQRIADKQTRDAQRVADKQARDAARAAAQQTREQAKQVRDAERARQKALRDTERARSQAARAASARRNADAALAINGDPVGRRLTGRAAAESTVGGLRGEATKALRRGDLQGYRAATIEANKLKRTLSDVNGLTGILRNSMLRLGTTLAATFGVFQAIRGFSEFVKSGLAFNDTIAKAEIGMAGLITALGDIRNSEGQIVTGAEAFGAAMGLAREQVEALRQDSLSTTASLSELLSTLQVSVGPGLAQGLKLDEIRKITVGISQAAAAISLPQNQLAEEVRSLLSGTIQLRTTRIAAVLGITNADVRRWKEIGTLSTEIQSRLAAFNKASEEAARSTLSGVGQRLADALSQAAGKAGEGLFKTLLDAGNDFFDRVVTIRDELGNLKPNPQFIASFSTLFNAVERIAKGVIGVVGDLDKLNKIGKFIGTGVTVLFESLAVIVGTLVTAMQALSLVFETLAGWTGITAAGFGRFLGVVVTVIAALKLLHSTALALIGIRSLGALANPWVAALTAILGITAALRAITVSRTAETVAIEKSNEGLRKQLDLQKQIVAQKGQASIAKEAAQDEAVLKDIEKRMALFALVEQNAKTLGGSSGRRQRERLEALRPQQEIDVRTRDFLQQRANRRDEQGVGSGDRSFFLSATRRALSSFSEEIDKVQRKADELSKEGFRSLDGVSDNANARVKSELETEKELNSVYTLRNQLIGQLRAAYAQQRALAANATAEQRGEVSKNIAGLKQDLILVGETIKAYKESAARAESARAALKASAEAPAAREANRETETRLRTERGLEDPDLGSRRLETLRAQADLIQIQERSKARQAVITREILVEENNTAILKATANEQEKRALDEQLALKRNSLALEIAESKEQERAAANRLRRAQMRETGTIGQGADQGRRELVDDLPTNFEAGINIMKGTVTSFASFASQQIVDAFDPNAEGTIAERFGQFFQQIAQMWLEEMLKAKIQAGLADAVTGVAAASTGGIGAGGGAAITGFSKGGAVKGPGRKGKDSITTRVAPGEYILNADAVDNLGLSALHAFNSGDALGGLAALTAPSNAGSVAPNTGAKSVSSRGSGSGGAGSGGVVLPVLVSNERQLDQMLRGGKSALGNRMRESQGRRIRD
jgi:hypothetical protein